MLKIGITGGIGSGKSVVCKIFSCLGVPVYDADSRAKLLYIINTDLKNKVIASFGNESYLDNGEPNRAFLASAIFGNPDKKEQLNAIVHPLVAADFVGWMEKHSTAKYIVKEAALLFESGSFKQLDETIVVTAPEAIRIDRIKGRDTWRSENEIKAILASQWPENEKIILANYVIENSNVTALLPQVLNLHYKFSIQ